MRKFLIGLLMFAATASAPLICQEEIRRINTSIEWDQTLPSVAVDGSGNMAVVWQSGVSWDEASGLELNEIFARRLDAGGEPIGPEFQINSVWTHLQEKPRVAFGGNGRFAVVWVSHWIESPGFVGLSARIFDFYGSPVTSEFQVNQYYADHQGAPDIAMDPQGNLIITWHSWGQDGNSMGIFARIFNPDGLPFGPEFQLNQTATDDQMSPAVASDGLGNFVVVWTSYGQDGDKTGIFARNFNRLGQALGPEFPVNQETLGWQERPDIAMNSVGGFLVCWQSYRETGTAYNIRARIFDRTAQLKSPEFQVNTQDAGWQVFPSAASDPQGNVLLAWQSSENGAPPFQVRAVIIDPYGSLLSQELGIDQSAAISQENPAVFLLSPDNYGIVWEGQDQNDRDIYARFHSLGTGPEIRNQPLLKKNNEKKKNIRHPFFRRSLRDTPGR